MSRQAELEEAAASASTGSRQIAGALPYLFSLGSRVCAAAAVARAGSGWVQVADRHHQRQRERHRDQEPCHIGEHAPSPAMGPSRPCRFGANTLTVPLSCRAKAFCGANAFAKRSLLRCRASFDAKTPFDTKASLDTKAFGYRGVSIPKLFRCRPHAPASVLAARRRPAGAAPGRTAQAGSSSIRSTLFG